MNDHRLVTTFRRALPVALAGALTLAPQLLAQETKPAVLTLGSSSKYQTIVETSTEGTLNSSDLRQVSVLGARIVHHLNRAIEALADSEAATAKSQLEKGLQLAGVIRELLPVTVVETTVKEASGREVYRSVDRVQDDRIPLFEQAVAVEVMQPIIEAKENEARVEGVQLAEADLVYTSALLDLRYVERKMRRALAQLDEDRDAALGQLVLAQTHGIDLVLEEQDHPLLEAQAALRIAENMVAAGRFAAARANLQMARNQIELYHSLAGPRADQQVAELDQQIEALMKEVEKPGAIERIREFWNRLSGWFTRQPGQATTTEGQGQGGGKATGASGTENPHSDGAAGK